eukprot:661519-Rhodomonas_salina.1
MPSVPGVLLLLKIPGVPRLENPARLRGYNDGVGNPTLVLIEDAGTREGCHGSRVPGCAPVLFQLPVISRSGLKSAPDFVLAAQSWNNLEGLKKSRKISMVSCATSYDLEFPDGTCDLAT